MKENSAFYSKKVELHMAATQAILHKIKVFSLIFGGYMSFYGITDTHVLDFWCHLLWVSKPE